MKSNSSPLRSSTKQSEMVLVPRKPTKAMLNAAHRSQWLDKYANDPRLEPETVWAAMIAAAVKS